MGFLVRGALAVGNVYRTDSNILGTGYQEAVNGEKAACNPQIVLTESAKKELCRLIAANCPTYAIFAQNESVQILLDSIYPHADYMPTKSKSVAEYYGHYREIIVSNLPHKEQRVSEKWRWFAGFFNSNVRYFGSMIGNGVSEIDQASPRITMNYLNPPASNQRWLDDFRTPGATVTVNVNPHQARKP